MKRFDDRQICFHSGKKISPPMERRRVCACCGLRIVKGMIAEVGHVGEDCALVIERRQRERQYHDQTVVEFVDAYKRKTGWNLRPSVIKTLQAHYA